MDWEHIDWKAESEEDKRAAHAASQAAWRQRRRSLAAAAALVADIPCPSCGEVRSPDNWSLFVECDICSRK